MKIEYVTVCVNYIDFFRITYEIHKKNGVFDNYIVVTDNKDDATYQFCLDNGIDCVRTDKFYENGAVFNKGLAINEGFKRLKYKDWVCFMDADTFCHDTFRQDIENYPLNKEFFYGTERVMLRTPKDLKKKQSGAPDADFEVLEGFGYGWFQMINWQSKVIQGMGHEKWYPSFPDCRESDWMFREKWGTFAGSHAKWKGNFDKLPFRSMNLGDHGVNHFGRKSPLFKV